MSNVDTKASRGTVVLALVAVGFGGFAALGWEIIWQLKTSLAIGVSSQATAVVISATMGGMALGTVIAGLALDRWGARWSPLALYGLIELFIGLCGLFVGAEFDLVARLDAQLYQQTGFGSAALHLGMIAAVLGPPAMAMGMSIPVLGLAGRQLKMPLALLYGTNTFGAALGTLAMAFIVVPALGVYASGLLLAGTNLAIAVLMFGMARLPLEQPRSTHLSLAQVAGDHPERFVVVFLSGFSVFALEVVFFRAMRAAFLSTTYTFAVLLGAVLVALALGANAARLLETNERTLGTILAIGGAGILIVEPIVERMDSMTLFFVLDPHLSNFFLSLAVVGPVVAVLGVLFPYLLDRASSPVEWGLLHACNTIGAITGALVSAWILLPNLGIAKSSWVVGGGLVLAGAVLARQNQRRAALGAMGAVALVLAVVGQSGLGETRIFGQRGLLSYIEGFEVIAHEEAPDFTVSVVQEEGQPELYIDGFSASSAETGQEGYMAWMGRLPMLVHPDPDNALIICFGRGETAHALRRENPERLDIVDISETVFSMADHFPMNERVLDDPRVHPIVMDGRAWLRRTDRTYDVITLEPMPPTFAGMNALYSKEFYDLAKARLGPGGTIAQWVPFHLITPEHAAAISGTFQAVFPDSILWIHDGFGGTGILIGRAPGGQGPIGWPGLSRPGEGRELTPQQITDAVRLDPAGLARYAHDALIITDDNQYLAYSNETRTHNIAAQAGGAYLEKAHEQVRLAAEQTRTEAGDGEEM